MKISFPHMGNLSVALAGGLRALGAEVVIPPYTNKRTLSIGTKNSPETICLPYKLVLGNYVEAIEAGTEALIMINSPGLCRLGQYSNTIKEALKDMGHDITFIDFDLYGGKLFELYSGYKKATGNASPTALINAVRISVLKMKYLDKLDDMLHHYRPIEVDRGTADKRYQKAVAAVDEALTIKEIKEAFESGSKYLSETEIDPEKEVLDIYITGEIYVVLDRFSNMEIEKELGRLGVRVHRMISVSDWAERVIIPSFLRKGENHEEQAVRYAGEYLKRDIGGDAIESVGDTAFAGETGADGIIHLLPFTCMPEIAAQNILPNVSKEKDIPCLSLVLDEFTGKAGFVTRLEAFVDLARRKKNSKKLLIA